MANSEEWLYNDVLDVDLEDRERQSPVDSRALDGEDLLDEVLTAPAVTHKYRPDATAEDELMAMRSDEPSSFEDSGSARFNAEQKAKMVQARIDAHKTSQGGALPDSFLGIYSREPNRKNSIFLGNLTWWTTDHDIIMAVRDAGLKEVKSLKFFENRANGQSKGYVLAELESEVLSNVAVDKLPEITIHGQKPLVMHASKLSPHQFESKCQTPSGAGITGGSIEKPASSSPIGGGGSPAAGGTRTPKPSLGQSSAGGSVGSIRPSISLPGLPPLPPGLAAVLRPPGGILPDPAAFQGGLPPFPPLGMPHINPLNFRPPGLPHLPGFDPSMFRAGAAAPHLNPAFLQEGGNMAELFAQAAARFKNQAAAISEMNAHKMASEEEANDANQRNRAISSSAITRAVADANAGDFDSAIDTLHMAINLIKQSVTANSETSHILIQSLQDCLGGIESQEASRRSRSGSNGGSGHDHRRSHDDRDRGRATHKSSRHHRDRSRERDRERDRDREHRR